MPYHSKGEGVNWAISKIPLKIELNGSFKSQNSPFEKFGGKEDIFEEKF